MYLIHQGCAMKLKTVAHARSRLLGDDSGGKGGNAAEAYSHGTASQGERK